jgi:hypothetical protein
MVLRKIGGFGIRSFAGKKGVRFAPTIVKQKTGGSSDSKFYHEYWEAEYPNDIEKGRKNDFNPGQQAIFEEYKPIGEEFCDLNREDYNPVEYIEYVLSELGDVKYNAISETIEQTAIELYDTWDHSTSRDGLGRKKFAGVIYD